MFDKISDKLKKAKADRSTDKEIYDQEYNKVFEEERTKALQEKAREDAQRRAKQGRFEDRFVSNLGKIGKGLGDVAVKGAKQVGKMVEEESKKPKRKDGLFDYEPNPDAFDAMPDTKRKRKRR